MIFHDKQILDYADLGVSKTKSNQGKNAATD